MNIGDAGLHSFYDRRLALRTLGYWLLYCLARLLADLPIWYSLSSGREPSMYGWLWWFARDGQPLIGGLLTYLLFHLAELRSRPDNIRGFLGHWAIAWASMFFSTVLGSLASPGSASFAFAMNAPASLVWGLIWVIIERATLIFDLREAELRLREAELRSIRHRLAPHFLFNGLNTIRALVLDNDAHLADFGITKLARVLRYALQTHNTAVVPLSEELEAVENYLDMEKLRFENRLSFRVTASPDARRSLIPPMLLQNLVENGVKHGVEKQTAPGEILVSAVIVENGHLLASVSSPGRFAENGEGGANGLDIIRQQLSVLYAGAAHLRYSQLDGPNVLAEMTIPQERQVR